MISCKCWFVCSHLFPTDWYWIDHWLKGSLPRCNIFAVCSGKCWLSPSAMALNVPRARFVTHTGMYGRWQHICIISQLGEAELTGWPVQVRRQWRMPTAAVPGMLATGRQAIEWLAPSLGAYCAESDNLPLAMKNTHDQRNTDLFTFLFAPAPLIAGFVVGTSLTLIVHNVNVLFRVESTPTPTQWGWHVETMYWTNVLTTSLEAFIKQTFWQREAQYRGIFLPTVDAEWWRLCALVSTIPT